MILHGLFRRAMKVWGLPSNPAATVERPRYRVSDDLEAYSPEEVWALVRAAGSDQDAALYILGRHEPAFIRSLDHLRRLARRAPFDLADSSSHERCVTFLPDRQRWKNALPLTSHRGDVTLLTATAREVFSITRLVAGRPGTAGPIIERELGAQVTTRNWNTIQRVLAAPR